MLENIRIHVTDMNIMPFTVGLLKPKIVLPKAMADSYSKDELKTIIQHEQTHIRLGHLWFGFAWDILRCLLWVNPFLTVFQKHFRADMEVMLVYEYDSEGNAGIVFLDINMDGMDGLEVARQIKAVVDKYGGDFAVFCDQEKFQAVVML